MDPYAYKSKLLPYSDFLNRDLEKLSLSKAEESQVSVAKPRFVNDGVYHAKMVKINRDLPALGEPRLKATRSF